MASTSLSRLRRQNVNLRTFCREISSLRLLTPALDCTSANEISTHVLWICVAGTRVVNKTHSHGVFYFYVALRYVSLLVTQESNKTIPRREQYTLQGSEHGGHRGVRRRWDSHQRTLRGNLKERGKCINHRICLDLTAGKTRWHNITICSVIMTQPLLDLAKWKIYFSNFRNIFAIWTYPIIDSMAH